MTHVDRDQLVLHYYGETEAGVSDHLAACEECRGQYQRLQRVLNTVDGLPIPERPANYEELVWQRVAPKLGAPVPRKPWFGLGWFGLQRGAAAVAFAGMLIAAFLIGQHARRDRNATEMAASQTRVTLIAVGDHLERSKMVLVELTNADPQSSLDISFEQRTAEDLIESNRLYRQTAVSTGDGRTADLLDDLERVLIEIAHSPTRVSARQLESLRREIQDRGILMKVSVFGAELEEKEGNPL